MQFIKNRWADVLLILVLVACIAFIFLDSASYPDVPWSSGGPPGFYPKLLASLLTILAIGLFFEKQPQVLHVQKGVVIRALIFLVLLGAAIGLLDVLGFRLTASGLSLGAALTLYNWKEVQPRSLIVLIVVSIALPLLLATAFEDFAGRRLPHSLFN